MSAHQKKHLFDFKTQYGLGFDPQDDEIVVDFFCGGGGAGTGLEMGLGRTVSVAKNHSPAAISMHTVNHPGAKHFTTDVFDGDPDTECGGKAVGWFHMSPDCTHHSQAAGGQPRKREIRNLSWIGLKWAGKKKPRVISLENVKQILQWGPLVAKRCKSTGRVVKLGGGVAAQGEVVPVDQQFLVPDPARRGQTWAVFVAELERLGYAVEWRVIRACDFGAPTSRERLFMIARCDGQPIVWPEPTHAKRPAKGQKPWKTAAECIDFTDLGKSIFGRKKDLAPATLRRVAKGMKKFVIDNPAPFIVPIANWSGETVQPANEPLRTVTSYPKGGAFSVVSPVIAPATHQGSDRINDPLEPLPTITCANRGELTLISPTLIQSGYGEREGQQPRVPGIDQPLGTVVAGGVKHALAAAHLVKFRFNDAGKALDEPLPTITSGGNYQRPAGAAHAMGVSTVFMAQMNGGFNTTHAKGVDEPMTTVTNTGSQQQLVAANLVHLRGNCDARDVSDPLHTISAGGQHHGLVTAFMERQFGASVGQPLDEPAPTVTVTAGGGGKSSVVSLRLSPEHEEGALRVAAFLISYYGTENVSGAGEPAPTITTKDRLALVTVMVKGTPYVIVDICLRMLKPSELYKAQGFPADYVITHGADGKPFTKTQQVHMCGNSVSPPPMAALARANDPWRTSAQHQVAA
ncbi:DNA methyltransferase [Pseudomonas savastanoi pv. fraxini]|uniref:DNA cytosine methyltransferase n=1 Tax=Pseudomonas savastanoi TaxID=29438 RepID=UPI000739FCD8|nr:DNA cytosine methyltransferase [Pseudomonas savastanoi]KUG45194.1 C-5 cytosine-specific DNA methylase family protein [Pseudomonas savastanoi pv. fraxini]KWS66600.1 DNA methyltransferase [Pseudomonas savastanoi pv. fraxini]PAB38843.1 DNA cytosine methyltransferase [Pseudomonas savastanoi pv. fraxini]RMR67829.1 C-5 cytosine-specific DNA methylase protein [Pseudomonas savastanoi pv. fraxini]RMR68522.1 C-5 cytosine-specific DNA methylase protein [Pseudomonas savastanoi pv. fraxini]